MKVKLCAKLNLKKEINKKNCKMQKWIKEKNIISKKGKEKRNNNWKMKKFYG